MFNTTGKKLLAVLSFAVMQSTHATIIYNNDGNKLDLNGAIHARHYFSDDTSWNGDNTFIRFGFKGQTKITDQLTGFGQWEINVMANHTESGTDTQSGNATRLGYAGLKYGQYGSLDYGRNWGIVYDVASLTDYAPIFNNLTYSGADNFMTGRSTGLLTYRNNGFFGLVNGLQLGLQYQGANDATTNTSGRSAIKSNGEGFGLSSGYNFDWGGSIIAAYASSKRTAAQQGLALGAGDKADIWSVGVKYDANQIYLAAVYAETHNLTPIKSLGFANKTIDWEAVAGYLFLSGFKPQIGYFQSKAQDVEGYGSFYLVKYYDAALMYYFNKNIVTYADYKINVLDKNNPVGISADGVFGLGLTYHF
ncbi:porin [Sodalis sp. dw_96]|uniref:porin n=1 Tax=Sodalis sp. dw_96 TaxID=2719794 RepID=UPI001BD4A15A|nr:porin [Sodalis sp. dw_96]